MMRPRSSPAALILAIAGAALAGMACAATSALAVTSVNHNLTVTRAGTGTGTVTSNVGAINCGGNCSDTYADGTAITLVATPAAGSQFAGWLGPCIGTGLCEFTIGGATTVVATFAPPSPEGPTLDIDGTGTKDPTTDGQLVLRYLFGFTGPSLIAGAIGPAATRTTAAQILDYLTNIRPQLDVDGNGQTDALTDGLLVFRYLSGLRGAALTTGAVGPGATRVTPTDIEISIGGIDQPPDPETAAPPTDPTALTSTFAATAFLYTGPNPIQTDVAPGTIQPTRVAVIRGKVLDRAGAALGGARVSILQHPEFGQTFSRADGMYDLVVNGGGKLIVRVQKTGYFEVHRDVQVPWQDYVYAADVALTAPDAAATVVDLTQPVLQLARGSPMTDTAGSRQATLMFPPGTTAQFRMPNGSLAPAPSVLTVRQTEYTVGDSGPQAMPSALPPSSGYTYYLELTADEELAAGAIGVEFNQPVVFYLENFIGFPTGAHAPVGFYDRQAGVWKGEPDGRVVKIIAINGGVADLDTNGDDVIDNGVGTNQSGTDLGITLAERELLASLYAAGQTLWRVETTHFSPGDINWPFGPPPDAVPPNGPRPKNKESNNPPCSCKGCRVHASIIECGNQTLGEDIPVVGTGMSLHYRSDRVPGRRAAYQTDIPLTDATVPASLEATTLEVTVAGPAPRLAVRTGREPEHVIRMGWPGRLRPYAAGGPDCARARRLRISGHLSGDARGLLPLVGAGQWQSDRGHRRPRQDRRSSATPTCCSARGTRAARAWAAGRCPIITRTTTAPASFIWAPGSGSVTSRGWRR